jgi:hypothetical protein
MTPAAGKSDAIPVLGLPYILVVVTAAAAEMFKVQVGTGSR